MDGPEELGRLTEQANRAWAELSEGKREDDALFRSYRTVRRQ